MLCPKDGRVRWSNYTEQEQSALANKFLGDFQDLDFIEYFWNPTYDKADVLQYQRAAQVWRRRKAGFTFDKIGSEVGVDPRKSCALISGKNLRPHLVQMYLISLHLGRPKGGWRWILERTPKPTNPFPQAFLVPEEIRSYQDIEEFIEQFPPIQEDHPALKLFGLSAMWAEANRLELFGFLLGFLIGDAGKYFPEYGRNSRHNATSSLNTNMKGIASNRRILTYVQLCLDVIGIQSHKIVPAPGTTRWTSESSNLLTWMFRVCLGLRSGERTSRNPVKMEWLLDCPREFLRAVLQGIAESDGSVRKNGYYAEIASVPNAAFFQRVLSVVGIPSRIHPKRSPRQVRINLGSAVRLLLFNPIIKSYRFRSLMAHAYRRGILALAEPDF